jgi:hypothetical protein
MKRLVAIFLTILFANTLEVTEASQPVNFLLITADDLEWSSVGVYGSGVKSQRDRSTQRISFQVLITCPLCWKWLDLR